MAMMENEMEKKVYKVEDVQNLLGLGRSKAYEFIENVYYDRKPFRVLKIGRSYRIPTTTRPSATPLGVPSRPPAPAWS